MTGSAGPGPRLDSVELKVTFSGARAEVAAKALAPDDGGVWCQVFFCEGPRHRRPGELPLLEAGVILRLRSRQGRTGDTTAKLRPCRRTRIPGPWLDFRRRGDDELRLESDWAGERQVLSAALTRTRDRRDIDAVTAGERPLHTAFSGAQERFLADCADLAVDFRQLTVYGPVRAQRWRDVRRRHHELTVERWSLAPRTGPPLDWLEVSERVEPEGSEVVRASLLALLRKLDLEPDLEQETKTRRVLEALTRDA
ncbi:hypothetical protein A6A06_13370 [Streptomyces sp. CB02923]|uniref:hypothetical protein n=1 Tax=Streptomyces sp. CB02923 TaxID=1718985 RepID=UPI00093F554D|nr:hypothetical protein [Streptomyces sp. CB02923]OKI02077.1 hypothetical protein A6A06_13370 [Streptomyces sp. CB02923]